MQNDLAYTNSPISKSSGNLKSLLSSIAPVTAMSLLMKSSKCNACDVNDACDVLAVGDVCTVCDVNDVCDVGDVFAAGEVSDVLAFGDVVKMKQSEFHLSVVFRSTSDHLK